jgi:hypothetical protein
MCAFYSTAILRSLISLRHRAVSLATTRAISTGVPRGP